MGSGITRTMPGPALLSVPCVGKILRLKNAGRKSGR